MEEFRNEDSIIEMECDGESVKIQLLDRQVVQGVTYVLGLMEDEIIILEEKEADDDNVYFKDVVEDEIIEALLSVFKQALEDNDIEIEM